MTEKHWRMTDADKVAWRREYWTNYGKCCQLCRRRNIPFRDIVSDHDHETGMTRAAVCRRCNAFLGHMETGRKNDTDMFATMRGRGVPAKDIQPTLRRMRTYIEYWRLRREAFRMYRADPADFAGVARANAVAALRYKRWLRKKHGLQAYRVTCWIDDKPHTHTVARRYRQMLTEGWPEYL
ncbi:MULTISPECIES: endonuclease domain-containing protein [pseudomallei group]|uniref:endonuclease domain-containing protein n=1 Tax=pseudomallei group TaxID=111527 RepID=UPI000F24A562|nr:MULTISPECIES: endonuclease domain-containing protein [pseudomallei group]MBO7881680.1 hypothetical protein [Burkholderia pseudomallei]MCS6493611.1 endonuclease VII domain-containing protein [Burkholderia thailandensis]NOK47964.1 hypothetical protein [Burkholderia thailandensis]CAJ3889640.1 Recombination endonuclease VII [Burkholderia pseudomallei]CAJ3999522.1 Recombination endonuclease VII [Burkholderia pseudomallei]